MKRQHKIGIALGLLLFVMLGGLLGVDRFAEGAAENRIADQAREELASRHITVASDPKVSIGGFPFLTQVVSGEYERIGIRFDSPNANGVQFNRIDLSVDTLTADAVSIVRGHGSITASQVTGTATMGWDAVREVLEIAGVPGVDPSSAEIVVRDNVLRLRFPLSSAGGTGAVMADGAIRVQDGKVIIRLTNTRVEGAVPAVVQRVVEQNQDGMSAKLSIPPMPYELTIRKVVSGARGLTVVTSAKNVLLAGR